MSNPLEKLIEKYQLEYDLLEKAINKCVAEWDFVGAESYRLPALHTRQQLRILKNLKNPNFRKIESLSGEIKRMQELDETEEPAIFLKMLKKRIPQRQAELKKLEGIPIPAHVDNDQLINALGQLAKGELESFEINFAEIEIQMHLAAEAGQLKFQLQSFSQPSVSTSEMASHYKKKLKRIGFATVDTTELLHINNFNELNSQYYLQLIARITFDVFGLNTLNTATLQLNAL